MFAEMQEMLDCNAADLLSGATDRIAGRCAYPMVVHASDRILPFHTATDYAAALRHLSCRLRNDHEVTAITARLRAIDPPARGRFRAWARLSYRFATSSAPRETDVTYFCRMVGGAIEVEMIEMECHLMPAGPVRGRAV